LLNQIGSTTISNFNSIAYDGVGNRNSVTASVPGATSLNGTTGYSYDSKNQITQETSTRNGGFTDNFGTIPPAIHELQRCQQELQLQQPTNPALAFRMTAMAIRQTTAARR